MADYYLTGSIPKGARVWILPLDRGVDSISDDALDTLVLKLKGNTSFHYAAGLWAQSLTTLSVVASSVDQVLGAEGYDYRLLGDTIGRITFDSKEWFDCEVLEIVLGRSSYVLVKLAEPYGKEDESVSSLLYRRRKRCSY